MNNAFVTLDGNLTRDPELRQVGVNNVCNYTVAVNTDTKNEDGTYGTNYYDCSTWGKSGEYVFGKLQKGTEVTVYGELEAIEKPDKENVPRTRLRVKTSIVKVRRGARGAVTAAPAASAAPAGAAEDDTE